MKKADNPVEEAATETGPASSDEPPVLDGDRDRTSSESHEEADTEAADLSVQFERLQAEFETLNDHHLRLAAEFSNYRRRAEGEMSEAWGRAQGDLLRRFLDALDDLERVSALDPGNDAVSVTSVVDGVDLVVRKFARALEEAGVEVIDPEPGDPFDPAGMEAMMRVSTVSSDDDDTVDQVLQKGYLVRSYLVRPARVSVRKHE